MGFLIFAYRKLFLKRKVSDLQFRQMQLSMKKQYMADMIGQQQQYASFTSGMNDQGYQNAIGELMIRASQEAKQSQGNPELQAEAKYRYMQEYQNIMMSSQQEKLMTNFKEQSNMKFLKNQDVQIDQEMASIESQLKLMTAELEQVEKAEDKAAKEDAPKFGLS